MNNKHLAELLRTISRKGVLEVILYINENPHSSYTNIQNYIIKEKIVNSQASITIILNGLTRLGLVDREISNKRPIKTGYSLSSMGENVLLKLINLEKTLKTKS